VDAEGNPFGVDLDDDDDDSLDYDNSTSLYHDDSSNDPYDDSDAFDVFDNHFSRLDDDW
jgi:hypothetical protein